MQEKSNRILLVSATLAEIEPLIIMAGLAIPKETPGKIISLEKFDTDILITRPGMVPTTFYTTMALFGKDYSIAINSGVAGSFNKAFSVGTVALVSHDRFADLGAESPSGFITGEKLSFTNLNTLPFKDGWLIHESPSGFPIPQLPRCRSVTSDTIHTIPDSIERITQLYLPDLETMEGAAFFYVCMKFNIPCFQIRAVSNIVGPRDKANWQLKHAVTNLCDFLGSYLPQP